MDPVTILVPLLVAGMALLGVVGQNILSRVSSLEDQLDDERAFNRDLWAFARKLLDYYYRFRVADAPDPPELPERKDR